MGTQLLLQIPNPVLPVAGKVKCELCGSGGKEEDGRRAALNASHRQARKALKLGLSPSKATLLLPRCHGSQLLSALAAAGAAVREAAGPGGTEAGGSGQAGGAAGGRPHGPWQRGWGRQQLLGQVEPGGQVPGREHQAAAAPA